MVAGIDGEEITYLSEFSIVFHDPGLHLHTFRCRLKGPKRRQPCGSLFKSYVTICICRWDEEEIGYLSEFSIVLHDPGLHLHPFRCRLKGPKRRQACGPSFKSYSTICIWRWDEEEITYLSEFSTVFHDPGLHLHPFRCRLKGPKRRQACGSSFKSYSTICICRWDEQGIFYLGEFSIILQNAGLYLHLFRCRLKGAKRWQAYGSSFKGYPTICILRWDEQRIFYCGEFFIISYDPGFQLHPFRCCFKGTKRQQACGSLFKSYSTICICQPDEQEIFYLGEFCIIISSDVRVHLHQFRCCWEDPERWQAYGSSFRNYSTKLVPWPCSKVVQQCVATRKLVSSLSYFVL